MSLFESHKRFIKLKTCLSAAAAVASQLVMAIIEIR